jgi:hypothetical protein
MIGLASALPRSSELDAYAPKSKTSAIAEALPVYVSGRQDYLRLLPRIPVIL